MSKITQRGATGALALTANGAFQTQAQSTTLYGGTATDTSLSSLLGSRWDLDDGREVALGLTSSGTTVVAGKLYQNAALIANHQNLTTVSFTAYSNNGNVPASVVVTLGGTATTVNQYQYGYAVVTSGTGIGQTLKIASHPAQASTTGNVTLTLEDSPNVALDATSKISLVPQTGNAVIINPTSPTNRPFGVSLYAVPASTYGYFVTKGITSCLIDASAPGAGAPISASSATAGAVGQTRYATNVVTDGVLGSAIVTTTSTQAQPVFVQM